MYKSIVERNQYKKEQGANQLGPQHYHQSSHHGWLITPPYFMPIFGGYHIVGTPFLGPN